ncbi:polyprenol phosphomannose-dependent alpha 1,6 mannosyltransferase MptB [Micromonospora sp. NPDC049559]|uniref:polyprenol phosphomannose-dependent alpha 1,6 mannosyltransferase MptB n=1 Tax=Micromonospora sp. NPDC049559 TaxID=3155923 RepID=UPI003439AC87
MRDLDHPARLRVAGLAATALLAAGAYGAGALPGADPGVTALGSRQFPGSAGYWLGLAACVLGLVGLALVWWRLGRSVLAPGGPSPRWLLVTGLLWAVPLLLAPPLASRDVYAYACQGTLWLDGVDPYSTGVADGGCPWVDSVPPLWRHTPTPYGPLAIALSGAAVAGARAVGGTAQAQLLVAIGLFRVVALGGGLLVARYLPRLARACGVDPAAAVWLGLLSPLVAVHAVSGAHNDALMVGLLLAALALATAPVPATPGSAPGTAAPGTATPGTAPPRDDAPPGSAPGTATPGSAPPAPARSGLAVPVRLAVAGAALGLATAVKVTAVVAAPFVVLLAAGTAAGPARDGSWTRLPRAVLARDAGALRRAVPVLAGAVLAFAATSVAAGLDLGWVGALRDTGRLVQWTSLPTGLGMAVGYLLRLVGHPEGVGPAIAAARLLGLVALAGIGVLLVVRAWRAGSAGAAARRTVVLSCGTAFAAFALLSPVFYPWYGLTAVAVLAGGLADPRWRWRLAAIVLVLSFLVLPNGLGLAVLTKLPGALLDVGIVAALLVAARRAVRRRRSAEFAGAAGPPRSTGSSH